LSARGAFFSHRPLTDLHSQRLIGPLPAPHRDALLRCLSLALCGARSGPGESPACAPAAPPRQPEPHLPGAGSARPCASPRAVGSAVPRHLAERPEPVRVDVRVDATIQCVHDKGPVAPTPRGRPRRHEPPPPPCPPLMTANDVLSDSEVDEDKVAAFWPDERLDSAEAEAAGRVEGASPPAAPAEGC